MASTQAVKLTKLVEQFQLEILNQGKTYDRCQIRKDVINRPALQILGFFDYFDPSRLQLLGKVEWTYLSNQTAEERTKCFDDFFQKPIPALILARAGLPLPSSPELRVFLSPRGALLLVRPGFGGPPEKIFWPSS